MNLKIHDLGVVEYEPTWRAMQRFTDERDSNTDDELWLLQHPPVFTQGLNGKAHHLLNPGHIPVVAIDRGGQVTYHGPGQLVVYPLWDIKRLGLGVRALVVGIENAIIATLGDFKLTATGSREAPGVYVQTRKIASIGLRIRHHASYHGLALNVNMDLEPFHRINPCGYQGLEVIDMKTLDVVTSVADVAARLSHHLSDWWSRLKKDAESL